MRPPADAVRPRLAPRLVGRLPPPPSFDTGPGPARAARLLLLCPVFAPQARIGARRWSGMAHWLAEAGLGLDVIAEPPAPGRRIEPELVEALPAGTRIYTLPRRPSTASRFENAAWDVLRRARPAPQRARRAGAAEAATAAEPRPTSFAAAEVLRRGLGEPRDALRAWWAWQEYEAGWRWARAAARLGRRLLRSDGHALVVTSGPPHPVAEAGVSLARETGTPFVLDLRDPWSLQPRLPADVASPVWYELASRGEARAMATARLVTVTSEVLAEQLAARHPRLRTPIVPITNGYDRPPDPPPARAGPRPFRIVFTGTLYLGRDPRPLFEAVARVAAEQGGDRRRLEVVMMGDVDRALGVATARLAARAGIGSLVELRPRGSQREAEALMASADQLVVLPWDNDLAIPGKLFEYVRHPAWLLAFARAGSALARLLEGYDADVVPPDDPEDAAAALRARLRRHERGERAEPLGRDERFSRRHQTRRLLEALRPWLPERPPAILPA